jgi:hypothetical protein
VRRGKEEGGGTVGGKASAGRRGRSNIMVYVDEIFDCTAFNPPRGFRGRSCHMWADTPAELMKMAQRIRLNPEWLDNNRNGDFPHFDLTKRRRRAAILAGAKPMSLKLYRRHMRSWTDSDTAFGSGTASEEPTVDRQGAGSR